MGVPFEEAIKDLNITSYDNESKYDIVCILSNGMRSTRKNYYLDTNRDRATLSFSFPGLKDGVYINFDPSMGKWDAKEGCDICTEESFEAVSWNYGESSNIIQQQTGDDYVEDEEGDYLCETCKECEEEEETPKKKISKPIRPRVVGLLFRRKSSYHNIHYMI